ncbi:ABC transporter permease [Lentibacillus sediminis]|uniref:ABC transporter permease n=1 Tax=Lentibacillus sediminis TaxID=1940529 RepID=UPI000C1C4223|nr:ABC transporter permease [Lentibacillus sediminis]
MNNFIKLVGNELGKIYIRKSTWAMYIIIAVLVIGGAALSYSFVDTGEEYQGDDWREVMQQENEEIMSEMENAESQSGFNVAMNPMQLEKNNFHLENDIQPTGYGTWQYVLENQGLLSIVSLLTIIVAAGIVTHEFKWGTIKLLLIRPISRSKILLSKFTAVIIFALVTLLFLLVSSWLTGAAFFGIEGWNPSVVMQQGGEYVLVEVGSEIITEYGLGMVNLVMMTTFAFMISIVFRNSSLAIGTAIFLMLAGNTVVGIFNQYDWAKYILFANTDLSQYTNNFGPPIEGMTMGFSISVLVVYFVIFMVLSWLVFTKRDVAGS